MFASGAGLGLCCCARPVIVGMAVCGAAFGVWVPALELPTDVVLRPFDPISWLLPARHSDERSSGGKVVSGGDGPGSDLILLRKE